MKRYIKSVVINPVDDSPVNQIEIASEHNIRPEILRQLYYESNLDKDSLDFDLLRLTLASNPNAPIELLSEMSQSPNRYIRELVAKNTGISDDILFRLAGDRDGSVKVCVANNPNASDRTLMKLMNSRVNRRDFWENLLLTILDRDDLDPNVEARARKLYGQYCP